MFRYPTTALALALWTLFLAWPWSIIGQTAPVITGFGEFFVLLVLMLVLFGLALAMSLVAAFSWLWYVTEVF